MTAGAVASSLHLALYQNNRAQRADGSPEQPVVKYEGEVRMIKCWILLALVSVIIRHTQKKNQLKQTAKYTSDLFSINYLSVKCPSNEKSTLLNTVFINTPL